MSYAEHFYLAAAGQSRSKIRHRITHEGAGDITRTWQGFVLRNEYAGLLGIFESVDDALRRLYAAV